MADFLEKIRSGKALSLRGNEWPENSQKKLIDKDLLHTTFEGTIALTMLTLDTLVKDEEGIDEGLFLWEKELIRKRVLEARKEEREQRMRGLAGKSEEKKGN